MNYFAHACHHLDAPYFVVGTAVPDLLSVCESRRLRREHVVAVHGQNCASPDEAEAQIVAGIMRHFDDDATFHANATFSATSTDLALSIRGGIRSDVVCEPAFWGTCSRSCCSTPAS